MRVMQDAGGRRSGPPKGADFIYSIPYMVVYHIWYISHDLFVFHFAKNNNIWGSSISSDLAVLRNNIMI